MLATHIILLDHLRRGLFRAVITGKRIDDFVGYGMTPQMAVGKAWREYEDWLRKSRREFAARDARKRKVLPMN